MTKQDIFDILSTAPNTRVIHNAQLATKCFICGDSVKNPNKKRLYIKIDPNNPKEPILYQCFNCFAKGVLTPDMLREMGIMDRDAESYIRQLNYSAMTDDGAKVNRYKNTKEIPLELPPVMLDKKTLTKIKYLYDRIGYRIPPEDFDKLKIVFNLKEFLANNNLQPTNIHVDLLDRDYVGFLSVKNEYVVMRDITGKNRMRYVKYNIFNITDNSQSFYVPKASVDLMTLDDIHVNITEGPFDTLGVIYNVMKGEFENNIFVASCDGSFISPLLYFIRKGLVGDNIYIDCYQDNDTRLNFKSIKKIMKLYTPNFTVYYNRLSKDFGVPASEIDRDSLLI